MVLKSSNISKNGMEYVDVQIRKNQMNLDGNSILEFSMGMNQLKNFHKGKL